MPLDSPSSDSMLTEHNAIDMNRNNADLFAAVCPWQDEISCIEAFYRFRWPDGFRCRFCQHHEYYAIKSRRLPVYDCKKCRKQTSLTAGTMLHGSRTPLLKWFQAICLQAHEHGVSAVSLARDICVTYKTAWLVGQKIRKVMSIEETKQLLEGDVFVTELIHSHERFIASSKWQKAERCVVVGGKFDESGEAVQVKLQYQSREEVPGRYERPNIQRFQHACVAPASLPTMVYYSPKGYWGRVLPPQWPRLRGEAADRQEKQDSERRKRLRGVLYRAGCWLAETFNGIGAKHLQAYLHQFCYTRNRRGQQAIAEPFLQECATIKAITYRELTGTPSKSARRLARPEKVAIRPAATGTTG